MQTAIEQLDDTRVASIEAERDDVEGRANALVISSNEGMVAAGDFLNGVIKPLKKAVHESCDPICDATNTAHKAATAQRKGFMDPLDRAESVTKGKINGWMDQEERRVAEENRRIEEENRKIAAAAAAEQAEKEAADARERQRLADEAAAAQRKADKALEDERLAHAANLEEAGRPVEAERVLNEPLPTPPPLQPVAPPLPAPLPAAAPIKRVAQTKVSGIKRAKVWKGELVNDDLKALCREIADGNVPVTVIKLEQGKLNAWVKALGGTIRVPCIRAYQEGSIAGRRG